MIRYTMVDSPFGSLLVAATGSGICRVGLEESDEALLAVLRADDPELVPAGPGDPLHGWAAAIQAYLGGEAPLPDLPLDVPGTPFQQRVWAALRAIPAGQTRTYAEIAALVGSPNAARAVGRACATNQVALLIPCHRVVPAGGGLAGFRWGIARKQRLLALEQNQNDRTETG